jgi:hypothetical protein
MVDDANRTEATVEFSTRLVEHIKASKLTRSHSFSQEHPALDAKREAVVGDTRLRMGWAPAT